jgi:hypothetical protein
MTIEHAERYLAGLRIESPSWWIGMHDSAATPPKKDYTTRQAKKLAEAAWRYTENWLSAAWPYYAVDPHEAVVLNIERFRFRVRVYDESQRLRKIAEGR